MTHFKTQGEDMGNKNNILLHSKLQSKIKFGLGQTTPVNA